MVALSPTTFSTGPDDLLATVDVYKQKGETIINELKDVTDQLNVSSLLSLTGGNLLLDEMSDFLVQSVNTVTGQLKVSADSLLKGILAANPELMSALKSLSSLFQTDLLKSNLASKIVATFNGVTSFIKSADLSTLNGLAKLINNLACADLPFSFSDVTGLISLAANAIKKAVMSGLNGAFSAFANCPKITTTVLQGIAKVLKPYLLSSTNNNLLLEIARSSVGPYLYQSQPDFLVQYLFNYKKKQGTGNVDYSGEFRKLKEAFSYMNPDWTRIEYGQSSAINATAMATASPYFVRTLEAGVDEQFVTIDTSDPGSLNTAAHTTDETYLLLVRNTKRSKVRPILKEEFPYSRVKVFEA